MSDLNEFLVVSGTEVRTDKAHQCCKCHVHIENPHHWFVKPDPEWPLTMNRGPDYERPLCCECMIKVNGRSAVSPSLCPLGRADHDGIQDWCIEGLRGVTGYRTESD